MDDDTPWWTVAGFWDRTEERWCGHYQALSARVAEDLAQVEAKEKGQKLCVCVVFSDKLQAQDLYATYLDPDQRAED